MKAIAKIERVEYNDEPTIVWVDVVISEMPCSKQSIKLEYCMGRHSNPYHPSVTDAARAYVLNVMAALVPYLDVAYFEIEVI